MGSELRFDTYMRPGGGGAWGGTSSQGLNPSHPFSLRFVRHHFSLNCGKDKSVVNKNRLRSSKGSVVKAVVLITFRVGGRNAGYRFIGPWCGFFGPFDTERAANFGPLMICLLRAFSNAVCGAMVCLDACFSLLLQQMPAVCTRSVRICQCHIMIVNDIIIEL